MPTNQPKEIEKYFAGLVEDIENSFNKLTEL